MSSKIKMFILMAGVFALIAGTVWSMPKPATATRSVNDLLTAADVTNVAGFTAKLTPKNPGIGAGGDLNFATADKRLILMVQVVNKSQYVGYKSFMKAPLKGIGEEALQGATMPGYPNNLVAFIKGFTCVALTVFGDPNNPGKNMLTIEQAIELAKMIASRM